MMSHEFFFWFSGHSTETWEIKGIDYESERKMDRFRIEQVGGPKSIVELNWNEELQKIHGVKVQVFEVL